MGLATVYGIPPSRKVSSGEHRRRLLIRYLGADKLVTFLQCCDTSKFITLKAYGLGLAVEFFGGRIWVEEIFLYQLLTSLTG